MNYSETCVATMHWSLSPPLQPDISQMPLTNLEGFKVTFCIPDNFN